MRIKPRWVQWVWVAAAAALPLAPAGVDARQLRRVLPEADLAPTLGADPREPALGGKIIAVLEGATLFGSGVEGEAQAGASFPVLVLSGTTEDRAVILGLQGGVFSRFAMDNPKRDLISTDWAFAVPVYVHRGEHWFRFRYRHNSSHLGDEYIARFEQERANYTRDALGFLGYGRVTPAVGMYAGGDWGFNVDPNDSRRLSLQMGLEFADVSASGPARAFGGIDVLLDQDSEWRPRVALQSGVTVFPEERRHLRFVLELVFGRSPQGEFHRVDETTLSLGLLVSL